MSVCLLTFYCVLHSTWESANMITGNATKGLTLGYLKLIIIMNNSQPSPWRCVTINMIIIISQTPWIHGFLFLLTTHGVACHFSYNSFFFIHLFSCLLLPFFPSSSAFSFPLLFICSPFPSHGFSPSSLPFLLHFLVSSPSFAYHSSHYSSIIYHPPSSSLSCVSLAPALCSAGL